MTQNDDAHFAGYRSGVGAARPFGPFGRGNRLIVGFIAVLILIGAVVYVLPFVGASGFQTARYLPSDTWFYATFTVRPGLLQLRNVATLADSFTSQTGFNDAISRVRMGSNGSSGVDFQKDVLPLLDGELSFAVVGVAPQPTYIMFVHSNDPPKLASVLARDGGLLLPTDIYSGHPISPANGGIETQTAVDRNWLLLASDRRTLEQTLDRIDSPSPTTLDRNTQYQSVVDRLPAAKLGFVYLDAPPSITGSLSGTSSPFSPYLENVRGPMALSLAARGDGLNLIWESRRDAVLTPAPRSAEGDTLAAFRALPTDTLIAIGGSNAPRLLSGTDNALTQLLMLSGPTNQLPSGETGLHFTQWLAGEFAIGLRPDKSLGAQGAISQQAEVYAVARVQDPTAAERDLRWLDSRLSPGRLVQPISLVHNQATFSEMAR